MRSATALVLILGIALAAVPACKKKQDSSSPAPAAGTTPVTPVQPGPSPMPTPGGGNSDPNAPTAPVFGPSSPRVAAARADSQGHLKQIAVAMHNYHDVYQGLPAGIYDASGKVGLSWRVAILPFIEQDNLYRQFKLDEPWDSENNKKLISMMPKIYDAGGAYSNGYTFYRSFTGTNTIMPTPRGGVKGTMAQGLRLTGITDGTSNTFMVAEAYEPVIWTKPDEMVYSPTGPAPKLGGVFASGFNVVFCDASVKFFTKEALNETEIKALITASGAEVVNIP